MGAEAALARSVSLHASFIHAMQAAVIGTDTAGTVILWNPFAEHLYGWSADEVIGRNIMEITVSSLTSEEARRRMAEVIAGDSWAGEFEVLCKDGSYLSAFVTLSSVKDATGQIAGVVGVSQDLSSLKAAEGALQQSEEQFRVFANSLPELCWMAYGDGSLFWYSDRWYEYTGTTPEQMFGWGWQSVHDPALLPSVLERWSASLESGQPFEMEFPLRGADGNFRWFLTRIMPFYVEGKITRWYGTNTNIDEQRRLLHSLSEARDDLEKRVTERTGELRTATDSLRELSARLLRLRDDEQRRLARELHDSVGQLLAAVGMNLAVVSAESQKLSPSAAKCVAENADLIQEVTRQIRTISHLLHPPLLDEAGLASALRWYVEGFAKRSGIEVNLEIPDELGRLPNQTEIAMFRVVQECLTNIHRHSGSPTASVRIFMQKNRLLLEVEDHGKGIAKDTQRKIEQSGEMGVGFSGMRERLWQLGGALQLQSGGNGTLVKAVLPIDSASAGNAA
ncbi:MAG TPA: PAS domain S-box protein [Candidatus Sulfotelmatobacter sp.]